MVGVAGRSGGWNRAGADAAGDGRPEVPRRLSPRAAELFAWIVDRLIPADGSSPWGRIDGLLIATLAETIEAEEMLAARLKVDPENLSLFRLRGQYADRLSRLSALVPLCPRDRERLPTAGPAVAADDAFASIMRRMSKG